MPEKRSILFVDDEETAVKLGKEMLEDIGYKVMTLTCSKKALATFQKNPQNFDLVVTDYHMPDLNGGQLAIKLKEIRGNIPVLLCTGCKNITETNLLTWRIDKYLLKPYQTEDIEILIKALLN